MLLSLEYSKSRSLKCSLDRFLLGRSMLFKPLRVRLRHHNNQQRPFNSLSRLAFMSSIAIVLFSLSWGCTTRTMSDHHPLLDYTAFGDSSPFFNVSYRTKKQKVAVLDKKRKKCSRKYVTKCYDLSLTKPKVDQDLTKNRNDPFVQELENMELIS